MARIRKVTKEKQPITVTRVNIPMFSSLHIAEKKKSTVRMPANVSGMLW